MFEKILALRLEEVIPSLVNLDQEGFVAGRQSANNMRRLFQVMYSASSLHRPVVTILLDAKKAFDGTEWSYLFNILTKFGFGPICMKLFRALYHEPVSSVRTFPLISVNQTGIDCVPIHFYFSSPLACAIC